MKIILTIIIIAIIAVIADAKPMTASVESWEGKFTIQKNPTTIAIEGKPKLILWIYQLDKGSKGTCIGFSNDSDMIFSPKPNEKGVQPIYTGYSILFGEDETVEIIVTYDVQGNGGQKTAEKYKYDGKKILLTSRSQFFGKHDPVWKKITEETTDARDKE